ncbi:MAG: hypothetical protein EAY69_06290 [Cytophagales bacterium]|nr:MAG: hypothetical protein EAY69_06290 [Cytophagales bacterium]
MKLKYKDDINILWGIFCRSYSTYSYTDENTKIFLEGYFVGQEKFRIRKIRNEHIKSNKNTKYNDEYDTFEWFLGRYLFKEYNINNRYNSITEQIDHYAFLKEKSFKDGFMLLLDEINNLKNTKKYNYLLEEKEEDVKFFTNFETHKIEGEHLDNVVLKNGIVLRIGDYLEVGDKIGEDYKKLKSFDVTLRNPSWELFYPADDKDFKHIRFCFGEDEKNTEKYLLGNAWRIFSETISQIEYIVLEDNKIFVYTDIFKIEIQKAFDEQECKILTNEMLKNSASFRKTIGNSLGSFISNYEMGLITSNELINQIWDYFPSTVLIYDKSWKRTK